VRRDLIVKYAVVLLFVALVLGVSMRGSVTVGPAEVVGGLFALGALATLLYYLMFVRGRRGRP
jgi:uncharacterized RDD family membrane protein YckC